MDENKNFPENSKNVLKDQEVFIRFLYGNSFC